jgi:hypothetical protein
MDKLGIVIQALQQGQEIELAGNPLRLFRAGDVVLFPSGLLRIDEDRLLRRLRRVRVSGRDAQVWMDGDVPFNWLINEVNRLSSAAIAQISTETLRRQWQRRGETAQLASPGGRVIELARARK